MTTYAHLPALVNDDGVMVGYVDANGKERDLSGAMIPPGTTPTPGGGSVAWADITGVPAALTSAQAAGTPSIRAIGTTATTAKAGNYAPAAADISNATATGIAIITGADSAAVRTTLGLGSLATISSVTAGFIANQTITNNQISTTAAIALTKLANVAAGTDGLAAGTIQATLQALATRIQALEDAAP